MITHKPHEALLACLKSAGSQVKLAKAIGCTQTSVWKMLQVKRMSVGFVLIAERRFGVSRHDLRPDIYGPKPGRRTVVAPRGNRAADAGHRLSDRRA